MSEINHKEVIDSLSKTIEVDSLAIEKYIKAYSNIKEIDSFGNISDKEFNKIIEDIKVLSSDPFWKLEKLKPEEYEAIFYGGKNLELKKNTENPSYSLPPSNREPIKSSNF